MGIALAVVIPIVTGYALPQGRPAPPTAAVFHYIEALEPGDAVMVSFDYSPSSMPELHPQAYAVVQHMMQRRLRVISVSLNPQGTALGREVMATVGGQLGLRDGVDYVHLGFKPGGSQVILGIGESIRQFFPTTPDGRVTDTLPVMEGVDNYDDIALLVDFAAGNLPFSWIAYAGERYDQEIAAGITAVMAPDLYPYLQSRQLVGLINGLSGAAEYELLLDLDPAVAPGMLGMSAQSIAHLLIILLVILGNIAYFASGQHRRRRGAS